jgi:ankyrin repeat protein
MHATLRIAGDDADKLRAKMGEGEIADVNELAYFGHSGSDGQTLLMVACKYGRVNIIKMLINEYKVCSTVVWVKAGRVQVGGEGGGW